MTAKLTKNGEGSYKVVGDLSFGSVPDVWREAREIFSGNAAGKSGAVRFDLSEVTRSDSAGLALLIEWMRSGKKRGISVSFSSIPDQMQEIARVCGVADQLPGGD